MKVIEQHKLYLYEFVRLTKALYPNQTTQHTFKVELIELSHIYNLSELFLLEDLIKAITLINQKDRTKNKQTILSTLEDFNNAKEMMLPQDYKLSESNLENLLKLKNKYQDKPFNYNEICATINKSYSIAKILVNKLKANNYLNKHVHPTNTNKVSFSINYQTLQHQEQANHQEENIFEIMQDQWKDFDGFIDTQNRV